MTHQRTARGNRAGLAVTGLIALLAGAAAIARGLGRWPAWLGKAGAPVLSRQLRGYPAGHSWFWVAVAAACVLIALAALRWLAVQTRTGAVRQLRLEADQEDGSTQLAARAVVRAVQDDLAQSPVIRRSHAHLAGSPATPRLGLAVIMPPDASPAEVKGRLAYALARMRQALEADQMPVTVRLRSTR